MYTERSQETESVLELRIHGVNNTAPHDLLDLPADEVERVSGDALGSFWRPTTDSVRRVQSQPDAEVQRGWIPPGIQREAYSWGGMVRSSPESGSGAGGIGGTILGVLARIGWALLLPFSLGNAAAWAWRMPTAVADSPAEVPRKGRPRLSARAGVIRVFGTLLTLLLVTALATLAIDLVALQCFTANVLACTALPSPFASIESWTSGRRMDLLSLVPIVALLALWLISSVTRLRYNVASRYTAARDSAMGGRSADRVDTPPPLLAHRGFWNGREASDRLAIIHLAAGIALVSTMLSTFSAVAGETAAFPTTAVSGLLVVAALLFAYRTRTMPMERPIEAPIEEHGRTRAAIDAEEVERRKRADLAHKRSMRWPIGLTVAAGLGYVASLIVVGFSDVEIVKPTSGWAAAGFSISSMMTLAVTGLIIITIIAGLFFRATRTTGRLRFEAWHGLGPAVFMTAGLGCGLVWTGVLTIAVGNWLNGGAGASALLPGGEVSAAQPPQVSRDGELYPVLTLPTFYAWFAGIALILLIGILLVVAVALFRRKNVTGRYVTWVPPVEATPDSVQQVVAARSWTVGSSEELEVILGPVRDRKRSAAARLHLAEPLIGLLAAGALASIIIAWAIALAYPVLLESATAGSESFWAAVSTAAYPWLDVAIGVWGLIGILAVAGLASGVGSAQKSRPLALVWDLACFLPRTGHPLGPPCYTERAVPEVSRRILWWLGPDGSAPASGGPAPRVIVSAHSMGAVVAVASLFSLSAHSGWSSLRDRVSLVTFGVQLRPYFGRFFPELLGPDVLGVAPCERPRLWKPDPWQADYENAVASPDRPRVKVPVRRWISLWRLTDYLGFAAFSNSPVANEVDVFTDEIDTTGYMGEVGTHGEYYRNRQYQSALATLMADGAAAAPAAPPGPPTADGDGDVDVDVPLLTAVDGAGADAASAGRHSAPLDPAVAEPSGAVPGPSAAAGPSAAPRPSVTADADAHPATAS